MKGCEELYMTVFSTLGSGAVVSTTTLIGKFFLRNKRIADGRKDKKKEGRKKEGNTVEPEFYDHPFCLAKVVVNARWSFKTLQLLENV